MGGRIAIALALNHPNAVNKLVLCSTSFIASKKINIFKPIKWIKSILNKSTQPYFAFKRQLEASRSYNCRNRLQEIDKPVLILQGKSDHLYSYKEAEEMHAKINGSKLILFEGGHMFFVWESKQFTDRVSEFLNGHN